MADRRRVAPDALLGLGATELRDRLARGALGAGELAGACLKMTAAREPDIGAWAWLDSDYVLKQAEARDAERKTGRPIGPLHGVPVAVKDIIDTAGVPTENGVTVDRGRVPSDDAAVVERLKQAGAIVMGKTVTTELAFMHPSKTRNPHNPAHTPGGSSAGSAAAVAAGMVPLAIGSQTNGSVIRPASFCGVTGFKPTFGTISRAGMLPQAPTLDTVGVFGQGVSDVALLADVLFGVDFRDPATDLRPAPRLFRTAMEKPPVTPMFAFYRPPGWDRAEETMKEALGETVDLLGEQCFEIALPNIFDEAGERQRTIQLAEMAKCYYRYETRGGASLSDAVRAGIEEGKAIRARDYIAALDWRSLLNAALEEVFDRCDAIITPAAVGAAPASLDTTGDPVFNGLWTLCGVPVVTLPVFADDNGMPMGLQLVGRRDGDARLLRTARWLVERLAGQAGNNEGSA